MMSKLFSYLLRKLPLEKFGLKQKENYISSYKV